MTTEGKPCADCPWVSKDPRDIEALKMTGIREAVAKGDWMCCHKRMGTCYGALFWGRSIHAEAFR